MIPKFLQSGDTIGIVSTARKTSLLEITQAIDFLEKAGLKILLGENIFKQHNQYAGTDSNRLSDFQNMVDNSNVQAILCARGGYGSVRIIDQLNFESFTKNPKWIIGYSDITVFHNHINQILKTPTIHGSMPISFPDNTDQSLSALTDTIFGKRESYRLPATIIRQGKVEGKIVGGNLSIIYSLMGSNSQINTDGKILFIEDIDEMVYHIDRMMIALKRAGMLSNLKGLIVGGMTGMRDNTTEFGFSNNNPFGKTACEIILEAVEEYTFPVCLDFPAGHQDNNYPIIMGMDVEVEFSRDIIHIKAKKPTP